MVNWPNQLKVFFKVERRLKIKGGKNSLQTSH